MKELAFTVCGLCYSFLLLNWGSQFEAAMTSSLGMIEQMFSLRINAHATIALLTFAITLGSALVKHREIIQSIVSFLTIDTSYKVRYYNIRSSNILTRIRVWRLQLGEVMRSAFNYDFSISEKLDLRKLMSSSHGLITIKKGREIVGLAIVYKFITPGGLHSLYYRVMAVKKEHQNRGLGDIMFRFAPTIFKNKISIIATQNQATMEVFKKNSKRCFPFDYKIGGQPAQFALDTVKNNVVDLSEVDSFGVLKNRFTQKIGDHNYDESNEFGAHLKQCAFDVEEGDLAVVISIHN